MRVRCAFRTVVNDDCDIVAANLLSFPVSIRLWRYEAFKMCFFYWI